jgi:ABC-type glycerol-3-phosphate transport system substrate-binding protein
MAKKAILVFLVAIGFFISLSFDRGGVTVAAASGSDPVVIDDGTYRSVLSGWLEEDYVDNSSFRTTVAPADMSGGVLLGAADSYDLDASRGFGDDPSIELSVVVPSAGLYHLSVRYYSLSEDQTDLEIRIDVNGELPYQEARQIVLPKVWRQTDGVFPLDRYGNDFYGEQEQVFAWYDEDLSDPMGLWEEPLCFLLEAGRNDLAITSVEGEFLLGSVTVAGRSETISYDVYAASVTTSATDILVVEEAEIPVAKSVSTIQPGVSREGLVTPFAVSELKLNVLDGGTWSTVREEVGYVVDVPADGWYRLTFKVNQSTKRNGVVFRTLRVNGEIPFAEAVAIPFQYSSSWQNVTLADTEGNPYLIHLQGGDNTISLAVDLAPIREAYYVVQDILSYVNATALEIRKLTGNQLDEDRDWNIEDYMPTLSSDLYAAAAELEDVRTSLAAASTSAKESETESSLRIAIRNLRFLADDPNAIPKNVALLSSSSSSIAQTLGTVTSDLLDSPLTMDKFYVHGDVDLPAANQGFLAKAWLSIRRFFLSFFDERYGTQAADDELDVWVNRPKVYADLIQKMADEDFTAATGIKVRVSVLADEGKLILANSANRNPDVALGISSWMPYDLGIRGALLDLSQYADDPAFVSTLANYPEQTLLPMIYDEGLYGLPDTENFYVLFYRTDILAALDLTVPDTWDDVVGMMPVLRRYGLNFYLTLSSSSSLKSFDATLPFLFQYGSRVYSEDAFSADLNNTESIAALRMMTDLYAVYGLETTVSNFYNDFRLGTCPIGIGDFGMYIRLLNAAPDIQGLWGIAVMPGVEKEGGVIDRSSPGAQTANVIFANSDRSDDSWAFLTWWASTETQVSFQSYLLSTLGREYLWNSANIEAFAAAGYDAGDMEVILSQWEWLRELPKVPGSYQVELEISNIWNSVVLERANLRVRLNDALIVTDREIRKKMAEFGYLDKQGNIIRPYVKADVSLIRSWLGGGG